MRRVTRHACEDDPIPEEQETEGQRQLHSLLLQQLDTEADINRCVAKRKCFAPAALYRPFGEQAAGVKSLAQFQALQEGDQELASLRELGLSEQEVQLWRTKDLPDEGGKRGGICADPDARLERLRIIREKMAAREKLLSLPQRLSASRALSRREMEIEQALFHGSERQRFLSALYHQEDSCRSAPGGSSTADSLEQLYREVLKEDQQGAAELSDNPVRKNLSVSQPEPESSSNQKLSPNRTSDPSSTDKRPQGSTGTNCPSEDTWIQSTDSSDDAQRAAGHRQHHMTSPGVLLPRQQKLSINQPISSLEGVAQPRSGGPLAVGGTVEQIPEAEILANKETEEGIRSIPRFQNYQRGEPSKVLCIRNLSPRASLAQLVSLFSRFQPPDGPPPLYKLLTGRLKGQAYITFSDSETAEAALEQLNGYRLQEKPLVIQFSKERRKGEMKEKSEG
ncbi:hypothetical protein GJAV_G00135940 [Gymnothorax javanicus]|nr:hypothetical protein GJAV_G00135940 [Gymnothorax javanicus]